jgi:mannonate dehydratase
MKRRELLKQFTGGVAGSYAALACRGALGAASAGFGLALANTATPLEAAQTATRRGLPRLKITDVKVFRTQVGNTHMCNAKVYTSEPGLYGIGDGNHAERVHIVAETIEQYLKPAIVGRYCDEIEDIWQMANVAPYWRGNVDAHNAMSAIDGALWDIMGKRAGMPVYNFLGGKLRPALPMFTGVRGRDAKEVADNARRAMENGYRHLRVGPLGPGGPEGGAGGGQPNPPGITFGQGNAPGGGGVGGPGFGERGPIYREREMEIDYINRLVAAIDAIRVDVGFDVDLLAEADSMLTPAHGLVLAKALEPYRMFWLEETFAPEDIAWHEQMRRQASTPIALGEIFVSQTEWVPLVAGRLMDFMRMHISACGGLNMARKTAAMCEFFNVRTAWHGPGNVSPVGHAVNSHIDFAVPNFGCGEGGPFSAQLRELFPGAPERRNGMTYVNDLPGLGVDIDERVAAKVVPKTPGSDRGVRCDDGSPCRP